MFKGLFTSVSMPTSHLRTRPITGKSSTPTPDEVEPVKGGNKDSRNQGQRWRSEDSHVTCYNCNNRGHITSRCPNKALYCGLRMHMTQRWKGAVGWKGSTSKTSFWIWDVQRLLSITNWFQNARCDLERLLQFIVFMGTHVCR